MSKYWDRRDAWEHAALRKQAFPVDEVAFAVFVMAMACLLISLVVMTYISVTGSYRLTELTLCARMEHPELSQQCRTAMERR